MMKKFVLGLLVGVTLTAAGSAYADDIVTSIIGKTVQGSFPVKIDGKQLTTQAAVIDGTSYLPVRAVGEALNKDVTFNADLGIELKTKEAATPVTDTTTITQPIVTPTATSAPAVPVKSVQEKIDELNKKLSDENSNIKEQQSLKTVNEKLLDQPGFDKDAVQKAVDMYTGMINDIQKRITDYEKQIADLQAQQ